MAKKRAKGGNVKLSQAAARVDIADKCAMVAVAVPNASAKPKVFKAPTINDAVGNLNVSFKMKLKKLDGTTTRDEIKIQSLDDFEEPTLVQQSNALREQQQQMTFLHDFQNEIKTNSALREELKAMLESENKEKLVRFLKGWLKQIKKPEQQFLHLLQSNLSNK